MAKTAKERVQEFRQEMAEKGYQQVNLWLPKELVAELKKISKEQRRSNSEVAEKALIIFFKNKNIEIYQKQTSSELETKNKENLADLVRQLVAEELEKQKQATEPPKPREPLSLREAKGDATIPPKSAKPQPLAKKEPAEQIARREKALARIQELKAEGLSQRKIADQLNTEGLPTVSGRGKWGQPQVNRLLKSG